MTVVAYDDEVYQALNRNTKSPVDTGDGHSKPHGDRRASVRREKSESHAVTFHVNAKTASNVQKVKTELQKVITDNYVEIAEHPRVEFLDDDDVAKIMKTQSDGVIISVGENVSEHLNLQFSVVSCKNMGDKKNGDPERSF